MHSHRGKGYAYALPLLGNAPVHSTDQKNRIWKRLRKAKNERRYDIADGQNKFFFYAVYIKKKRENNGNPSRKEEQIKKGDCNKSPTDFDRFRPRLTDGKCAILPSDTQVDGRRVGITWMEPG